MKHTLLIAILAAILAGCQTGPTWSDEFEGSTFDTTVWSKIQRGPNEWNKHMALDDSLFSVENGCLILRGVMTPDSMIHTAGLETHGKKSFKLGRYEIRAKLPGAHGAWPALWMMPEVMTNYAEIDICEKLNFDDSAYQTIHSDFNLAGDSLQKKSAKGAINPDDFNVYGVEFHKDSIRFFINDIYTLTYRRMTEGPDGQDIPAEKQWPFDRYDWHIKIDMQIGAPWPGEARLEELPIQMEIDWIRFYQYDE